MRGGGGWLSEVSQAFRADSSSGLAKGSNSFKTSLELVVGSEMVDESCLRAPKMPWSYKDRSGVVNGLNCGSSVTVAFSDSVTWSFQGLGELGITSTTDGAIGGAVSGSSVTDGA